MSELVFFDTNVLVYLFDAGSPVKQKRAREILQGAVADGTAVLSSQVLQEFYVTVTRKLAPSVEEDTAEQAVRDLGTLPVVTPDTSMILQAIARSKRKRMSFWDSLIIETALASGASILLSEDLQHDAVYDGVTIRNPFL
jgi:predicted nucleic acid-binding protein